MKRCIIVFIMFSIICCTGVSVAFAQETEDVVTKNDSIIVDGIKDSDFKLNYSIEKLNTSDILQVTFYDKTTVGYIVEINNKSDKFNATIKNSAGKIQDNNFLEFDAETIGAHSFTLVNYDKTLLYLNGLACNTLDIKLDFNSLKIKFEILSTTNESLVKIDNLESVKNTAIVKDVLTTSINGEIDIVKAKDGSIQANVNEKRFTNNSVGDGYGQKGGRNRLIYTIPYDVNKPIVFYAKNSRDVWNFNLVDDFDDFGFTASTNSSPLRIQVFPISGIVYMIENGRGDTAAFRNGNTAEYDKFVIEVGETSSKITINDKAFHGLYENVSIKKSDFSDGKAHIIFSFFSNGTTQGESSIFNFSPIAPMKFDSAIKTYYKGSKQDITFECANMDFDNFNLVAGQDLLTNNDVLYNKDSGIITILGASLEKIYKDKPAQMHNIIIKDKNSDFIFANLNILVKRPIGGNVDNSFIDENYTVDNSCGASLTSTSFLGVFASILIGFFIITKIKFNKRREK